MTLEKTHGYFIERRKYPRFKPEGKMYIMHANFGTVSDISMGGLSYIYCSWQDEVPQATPGKGIIFSEGESSLDDIPFVVVSDEVIIKSGLASPEIKKRRIHFNGLTQEQLHKLELFLLANVNVPKV